MPVLPVHLSKATLQSVHIGKKGQAMQQRSTLPSASGPTNRAEMRRLACFQGTAALDKQKPPLWASAHLHDRHLRTCRMTRTILLGPQQLLQMSTHSELPLSFQPDAREQGQRRRARKEERKKEKQPRQACTTSKLGLTSPTQCASASPSRHCSRTCRGKCHPPSPTAPSASQTRRSGRRSGP